MDNNRKKVLFVYQEDEEYKIESLWTIKEEDNYIIDNIPFFINNIACGDVVSVEIEEDELYFEDLVKSSGNSTIQLVILDEKSKEEIGLMFEELDCNWEGSHLSSLLSIDIPENVNYFSVIKDLLDKGFNKGLWDYKEACISDNHKLKN